MPPDSPQNDSFRVAIIGAGVSGLSAAFYLRRSIPNVHCDLFESQNRVGGVVETMRVDDSIIERGADNFATLVPDAYQLSVDAGLERTTDPSESRASTSEGRGQWSSMAYSLWILTGPTDSNGFHPHDTGSFLAWSSADARRVLGGSSN